MRNSIFTLLLVLVLWPFLNVRAQTELPTVRTLARAQSTQILLRWEPSTEALWTAGIRNGYFVERRVVLRNNVPVTEAFTRLTAQPVQPASPAAWTPYLRPDSVQHQTLYKLVTGDTLAQRPADTLNLDRSADNDRRFFFGLLSASQSYSAARLAALGYIDTNVQANERYEYRVLLAVSPNGVTVQYPVTNPIGLADYAPLAAPMKPKLVFGRYYASVKWLHDTLQSPFVSYWIERSLNGTSYKRVNDRPFVMLNGATNLYAYEDSLPKGRKTYYYRIVGKTPFDEVSTSPAAVGQSKDDMVLAPRIKTVRLQPDNRVYMTWQFPGDTVLSTPSQAGADSLLKSFFISVAASPSDKPVLVQFNVNPRDTVAYIANYSGKVPGGSTLYFTLGAVRQDGDTLLSASVFVEPLDTIAPAKPAGLKGRIDANGQVYLSWLPNEESDLLGYKVFRSQRQGEEASAVSDTTLLLRSEFTDSITLNSLNPALFYQVKALDTHYNTSAPSVPLQLLKPDVVPPTAPFFLSDSLLNGQLNLTWAPSSSTDVVRQLLLRRETDLAPWQLLMTFARSVTAYTDAGIQPAKSYQYLLLAQDAAGMTSDSTAIRRIAVPASQGAAKPILTAFNALPDADLPGIRLSWSYTGSDVSEYQLYRAVSSKPFGLWKMLSGLERSADDGEATSSGTYRYKIQAVFKDGSVSNWQSVSAVLNGSTITPGVTPYVQQVLAGQQASVGKSFTYTLPDSVFADPGHTGIIMTILPQGLPDGLTAVGRTLSGIPRQAGTFTITVQGRQPSGYLLATTFSLTVGQLPTSVAGIPNLTVTIGQSFSYAVPSWVFASVGGQAPQISIAPSGLPSGVVANGLILQGVLSSPGPFTVTVQAQNNQGGMATLTWLLTGNQPPQVQTPLTSLSALIGQVVSWSVPAATFRDPDGQLTEVRIRSKGLPPGLAVRQNQLVGVPTTAGSYSVTVVATDNGGAETETTLLVRVDQAANQNPVLTTSTPQIEGLLGDSLLYRLPEGLFFDPDGRITRYTLTGTLPSGLSLSGLTVRGVPTQAGTFTLTASATDDRNSSISSPVLITISTLANSFTTTLFGTTTLCSGNAALLVATGCPGLLQWSQGSTGNSITVTPANTTVYSASCTSGSTTVAAVNTVTVSVAASPVSTISGNLTICPGQSTVLTASGGSTYRWSTGATTSTLSASVAGTYSVTVSNGSGCSAVANANVVINSQPVASVSGNLSICAGQSTTLTATGGTSYRWSTGATTASISASAAGAYSVTVSSGASCSAIASANVVVNALPVASLTGSLTICTGQSTTLTAGGGSTYRWNTGATTPAISASTTGAYSVTVTGASGCSVSTSTTVVAGSQPPGSIVASPSLSLCTGQSVLLTASGGNTYRWNTGATTAAISVSLTGTYSVSVTATGVSCPALVSATVVSAERVADVLAYSAVAGLNYSYYQQAFPNNDVDGITGKVPTAQGTVATFDLSAKADHPADNYGYEFTGYIQVTTPGLYTFYTDSDDGSKLWIGDQLLVSNNGTHGIQTASGQQCLGVGYHAIRVRYTQGINGFGLSVSWQGPGLAKQVIPANRLFRNDCPVPSLTGSLTICAGQSTTLTAGGGSTYRWNTGATTSTISASTTGAYSVTVTGASGCSVSTSTTVVAGSQPPGSIVASPSLSLCTGQSVLLTASGGNTYRWNTGATTAAISVSLTGTYSVSVTATGVSCPALVSATVVSAERVADVLAYSAVAGLNYSYYQQAFPNNDVDGITGKVPTAQGTVATFDLSAKADHPADNYGYEFTGYIQVTTPGLYTFYTDSDDGSKLWIGDQLLVSNNGTHGIQTASGQQCLGVGYHAIRVRYTQGINGFGLSVSWQGPGLAKQVIPANRLFH